MKIIEQYLDEDHVFSKSVSAVPSTYNYMYDYKLKIESQNFVDPIFNKNLVFVKYRV